MKSLLTILTLLFLTSAFAAQIIVQPPLCIKGVAAYHTPNHFGADFCVNGLKAISPRDCHAKMKLKSIADRRKSQEDFYLKRTKEVCGK